MYCPLDRYWIAAASVHWGEGSGDRLDRDKKWEEKE